MPKVLIIASNPLSTIYNNGKTLNSLFSWVEKDKLAQLYFNDSYAPDEKLCYNNYLISDKQILRRAFRLKPESIMANFQKVNENREGISKGSTLFKWDCLKLTPARDVVWSLGFTHELKQGMYDWVASFHPDIIFYVGGDSICFHSIAIKLSLRFSAKLFVYFTDDYVIYPSYISHPLRFIQKIRARKAYKKTVSYAAHCFVIGEKMAEIYSKYYGKEFHPIMNSVPIVSCTERKPDMNNLVFSYFGNLGLGRWKMICSLKKLIDQYLIYRRLSANLVFNIYSMARPDDSIINEFNKFGVQFCGGVSGEELIRKKNESDVLLHVENCNKKYSSFTRLSVSTKIPECMASRRLLLGYGPSEVASMSIIWENKTGVFIDARKSFHENLPNLDELFDVLQYSYLNRTDEALEYAKVHFDINRIQAEFKRYFIKTI